MARYAQILSTGRYVPEKVITNDQFYTAELSDQDLHESVLSIPPGKETIRIALTWNDPAAEPGDLLALINDLDLEVEYNGFVHLPLVPNSIPNMDLLS